MITLCCERIFSVIISNVMAEGIQIASLLNRYFCYHCNREVVVRSVSEISLCYCKIMSLFYILDNFSLCILICCFSVSNAINVSEWISTSGLIINCYACNIFIMLIFNFVICCTVNILNSLLHNSTVIFNPFSLSYSVKEGCFITITLFSSLN